MIFQGKKYAKYSLLNRRSYDFSLISREEDSLKVIEVKNWLIKNQQEKVKELMDDYLKIVNEHKLKTNLKTNKWFKEVYNYPNFTNFSYIKPYFEEYETEFFYGDPENKMIPNNRDQNKYSNYFVQQDILKSSYDTISKAHTNVFIEFEAFLAFLCGGLGLSLLLFSFKVTTGKSWLIAVVCVGVLNILFGILTLFISSGVTYFYLVLITFVILKIYFASIYLQKKSVGFSRIVLNILLWSFPFMIPIVYGLIMDYYKSFEYSIEYGYNSPEYNWLQENFLNMLTLNFIFCVIMMFFMSRIIRNWKGIAEE